MIVHPNVKINIGLNVLRRRPDGYHDIATLFYPYHGLRDTLEIVEGDDYSRTSASLFARYGEAAGGVSGDGFVDGDFVPPIRQAVTAGGKLMITVARKEGVGWDPAADLCAKAYALLDRDFNLPPVKIFLEKTAPVGAGLGGGSSDCAFTLKVLNEMFSLSLDRAALEAYASALGSDCAFFVRNVPMFGEGRGEVLTECGFSDLDGYDIQVVVPEGVEVSTAQAYRGIVPGEPAVPLREALLRPVEEWKDLIANDFEKTVFAAYPRLAALKQSLYGSGAVYASMSGSGSAVYGIYLK